MRLITIHIRTDGAIYTAEEKLDKQGEYISTWHMHFPFVVLAAISEANLNVYYNNVNVINNP